MKKQELAVLISETVQNVYNRNTERIIESQKSRLESIANKNSKINQIDLISEAFVINRDIIELSVLSTVEVLQKMGVVQPLPSDGE